MIAAIFLPAKSGNVATLATPNASPVFFDHKKCIPPSKTGAFPTRPSVQSQALATTGVFRTLGPILRLRPCGVGRAIRASDGVASGAESLPLYWLMGIPNVCLLFKKCPHHDKNIVVGIILTTSRGL